MVPLLILLAGPFVTVHTTGVLDDTNQEPATAALIAVGVVQVASVALFVAGLARKRDVLVRNDLADPPGAPLPELRVTGRGFVLDVPF